MKVPSQKCLLPICFALGIVLCGAQAVTLTVTPNNVSADFSASLTLEIDNGLLAGETVIVEQFFDLNGNGVADPGEPLAMSFRLTDGQTSAIGGVVNINVPHDVNPASAAITARMSMGEFSAIAAGYVFKVSSPTERFAPATAVFTVNDANHGQSISGVVRSNGDSLPYAMVVLVGTGHDDHLVAGAMTDQAGAFTISAPPGSYTVLPIKNSYLPDEPAGIDLESGASITQDVEMFPATRVVSGRLVDADDTGIGLPGVMLFFESEDGFTLTFTDGEGNFSASVTSGEWEIEASEEHLARLGYVLAFPGMVDAGAGDVTGLELALPKVTALFYGYLKDAEENPLSGVEIFAGHEDLDFEGIGMTDEDGYYVVGVVAGDWWLGPAQDDLAELGFGVEGASGSISDGQAVRVDFTAIAFTAYLRGQVVDQDGIPIADIGMNASNWSEGGWSYAETDENGNFSIGVFAGTWNLQVSSWDADERGLLGPSLTFEVTDGVDITGIAYVVKAATASISGSVKESDETPVAFIGVFAFASIDGLDYNAYVETDGGGNYSLSVINGTWTVGIVGDGLYDRGFATPENQTVGISDGNGTANFTVASLEPLAITTASLPDGMVGDFYSVNLTAAGGVEPYSWSLASGSDPLPPGLSLSGSVISGAPNTGGPFTFTVQVNDWFGESATKTLLLTINESGESPLRFTSVNPLPNGEVEMTLAGQEGVNYVILATARLSNPFWVEVGTSLAGTGGEALFHDSNWQGFLSRFYRARPALDPDDGSNQVWGIGFTPSISVTPCNDGQPLFFSSKSMVVDSSGNFDDLWRRGQDPNPEERVVRIYGSMSDTEFTATIECYPAGNVLMTLTASRQGNGYTGSFSGGTFSVDPAD